MNQTVYIKCDKSKCVTKEDVIISDIASVYCEDRHLEAKIKSLRVLKMPAGKSRRFVVSVLRIVELITQSCPGIAVENEGEQDIIIEYSTKQKQNKVLEYVKVAIVCFITLLGGAFAVMAYNNDIGAYELFENIYVLVLGEGADGHKVMEIAYSLGLAVGIIVFYGHFGNWKFGKDPTPLEVAMRSYEDEVDTAIVKQSGREEVEIDVD